MVINVIALQIVQEQFHDILRLVLAGNMHRRISFKVTEERHVNCDFILLFWVGLTPFENIFEVVRVSNQLMKQRVPLR